MSFSIPPLLRGVLCAAACLALAGISPYAMADGQPLVLDSQTGVHGGQSGVVLQSAPFSREPMVPAQQLPAPQQLNPTSGEPPIVVAPYIALPGANGAAPAPGNAYRMAPANRQ
ncbi:hypothetical protein [Trinickia soli]|nr:hypothetical protein [Trinickia soli]CAB3714337.1 hypothetical protein LMG24076_04188 [Trinickia soli]